MELAAMGHFRKRRDVERFVEMFEDVCLQPPENVRGQGAVRLRPGPHHVTRGEGVDELTRGLIPEQRPVWMTLATFPPPAAAETTDRLRFERSAASDYGDW